MPINPNVGAALIQGGANAAQGLVGLIQQNRQNEANMKMAEYQYSKDLEMWNRGNAYNAPEAQMQRLKAAGLNPNLVYGQGAPGQSAGTLPKYNAPTIDYSYQPPIAQGAANMLSQYQDFQIKQAQINNLREQNKVIRESGLQKQFVNWLNDQTSGSQRESIWNKATMGNQKIDEMATKLGWMNENYGQLMDSQLEFAKGKVRYQDQQIVNMMKQGRKIDASTDYQNKVNEWYLTKMFSQIGLDASKLLLNKVPNLNFKPSKATTSDAEKWRTFERNRGKWIGNN